ncbi:hypothetical protein FRC17_005405, partial [Serendipita sp. 399]
MSHNTLTEAVKEDHQEMYDYYHEYELARQKGDVDAQGRWARQLTWEVARHAAGEEIVVYPLLEKYLGEEGVRMANQDRAEHQEVKELLYHLESLTAGDQEYHTTLKKIIDHLKPHNDSEETNDLPSLEKVLGKEESRKAAASFSRTKKLAPTRPHPSAPNKPPYETLAGFLALPMDKIKDVFASFPTEEMKEEMERHENTTVKTTLNYLVLRHFGVGMATIHQLPYELLSLVFRYATLDEISMEPTYTDPGLLATYRFSEYERTAPTFETKSAISRVNRCWHQVSSQYLCEYIYCIGKRERIHWLAKCLEKKDNGGHRGRWTKRVDVYLRSFDVDWPTLADEEWDSAEEKSYYGWQHVLSLTSNVVVVDILENLESYPSDWTTQMLFSLQSLPRLRRVEWNGHGAGISDLMQLSTLCPQLIHIGITLNASSDPEASTDAFTIRLPETQTLLLHWTQKDHENTRFPPFTG